MYAEGNSIRVGMTLNVNVCAVKCVVRLKINDICIETRFY